MGESFTEPASVIWNVIRSVMALFDRFAYWLLMISYMLFFNVASADIFNNETIILLYGRIQVLLGVFMMFKLSMSILKGIVNPDSFVGEKGNGRTFIVKVMTGLLLLVILMPVPIGNQSNEFEKRINNNGLLFGTLYSLQHRILSNNTLGRIILGTSSTSTTYMGDDDTDNLDQSTRVFVSSVLKTFYRINLLPEDQRDKTYIEEKKDPALYNENRVCTDIDDAILDAYTAPDADPFEIISMINYTCDSQANASFINKALTGFQVITGSTKYIFVHQPITSFIVPLIFAFILLSFTIDVAVRAIKLAFLRLLAPIPIISYMDPNSGKDSAFNAWVKSLSTTYLDLFIRLATVYFVIFLIHDLIAKGISFNTNYGWFLNVVSFIAVWIGLFVFAKQAPKFIKEMLGLKGDTGKLFGGLGEILGVGALGASIVSGGIAKGVATKENGGNIGKSILSGIAGGIGGGINAGKRYFSKPETDHKAIMSDVRAYNDKQYANAADNSSFWGRSKARAQSNVGLQTDSQQMERKINDYNRAFEAWKRADNALNSDDKNVGGVEGRNVKAYYDRLSRMKSSGQYSESDIAAAEEDLKNVKAERFKEIREDKRDNLKGSARQAYDAGAIVYEVGVKYQNEKDGVFEAFKGAESNKYSTTDIDMGKYKGAGYKAGGEADTIKNSPDYAKAKANAQRADQGKK